MKEIHEGHRERLRERFIREKGFENYEDHQILELLLCYAHTRGDTNPLAHDLLDQFGSLKSMAAMRTGQTRSHLQQQRSGGLLHVSSRRGKN